MDCTGAADGHVERLAGEASQMRRGPHSHSTRVSTGLFCSSSSVSGSPESFPPVFLATE